VDRRKQDLKRSLVTDAGGIPLGAVPAAANRRDDGPLAATLDTLAVVAGVPERPVVHLDAGYDYQTCRQVPGWPSLPRRGHPSFLGSPAPLANASILSIILRMLPSCVLQ
jgi:hypothetical protein